MIIHISFAEIKVLYFPSGTMYLVNVKMKNNEQHYHGIRKTEDKKR